ncbi:MAG TPA: GFA family protein [Novosphingobium sp.]
MSYSGNCHCGAVAFTVEGDLPDSAIACNCSHCQRKGFLLAFVPAEAFTLDSGEDALADYQFNKHRITHRFCKTCGAQSFAEGTDHNGKATRAINLRCVPAADLDTLNIQNFDGASY